MVKYSFLGGGGGRGGEEIGRAQCGISL